MKKTSFAVCVLLLLIGCNTQSNLSPEESIAMPTATTEYYSPEMFVERSKDGFVIIETEIPSGILLEEISNSTGEYRAFALVDDDARSFMYYEEVSTDKIYVIKSEHLDGRRPYSDLSWPDENLLEFTVVNAPHHGVKFTVDIEKRELVDAKPTPLD